MREERELDIYFYIAGWILLAVLCGFFIAKNVWPEWYFVPSPCLFHEATGYYCPGCGGTRAFFALLSGHPVRSFLYHPIVLYAALVGGIFMISQTIWRLSGHRLNTALHYRPIYLWGLLFWIVLNAVIKNAALFFWDVDLYQIISSKLIP